MEPSRISSARTFRDWVSEEGKNDLGKNIVQISFGLGTDETDF